MKIHEMLFKDSRWVDVSRLEKEFYDDYANVLVPFAI